MLKVPTLRHLSSGAISIGNLMAPECPHSLRLSGDDDRWLLHHLKSSHFSCRKRTGLRTQTMIPISRISSSSLNHTRVNVWPIEYVLRYIGIYFDRQRPEALSTCQTSNNHGTPSPLESSCALNFVIWSYNLITSWKPWPTRTLSYHELLVNPVGREKWWNIHRTRCE